MAHDVTNYKCPACTGPLHFDGKTGKLQCDYCGNSYDVAEIEKLYSKADEEAVKAMEEKEANPDPMDDWGVEEGMKAYNCPSCGAQLICDGTTAATSCPYCGSPTLVPGQFSGVRKPDYVLPFKLDKEAAVSALKIHYKGKRFLPNSFKDENHIQEIKGVYVPFWMFDAEADAKINFEASNSHTYESGKYRITETEHYDVYREGTLSFSRIPVDASTKMPDDYMDSIEPFDFGELKEYSPAYLPGFLADRFDVTSEDASERADDRCRKTTSDEIRSSIDGFMDIREVQRDINVEHKETKYALIPVWLLSTRWNDKNYLFAMNGQTGKIVGDLPVDKRKKGLWFWSIGAGITAVLTLIFGNFLGGMIMSWLS